jgi:serine/threonine protein kinase
MARNNELHILGKGHYGRIYLVCVDMNSGQVMEADDAIVFMKERKDRLKNGTGTGTDGMDGMDVLCFALKETKQAYQGNKRKSAEVDIVDAIIAYRDNHSGADLDEAHGIMYFADTRQDEEYERDYIAMEIVSKSISHEMKKIMEFSGYGGGHGMNAGMKGGNDASTQLSMLWNQWIKDVYKTLDILHTKLGIYHLDVNVHNIMLRRRMEITDDTATLDYDIVLGDFGHAEFKQKLLSTEIWGTEGVRMVKEDEDRKLIKMLLEGENAEKWILFDAVGSMDEIPRVESFLERNGLLGKIHKDLEKNGETLKQISRTTYKEVLFREIWNAGLYEKALKSMNKVNYLGFLKA